MERGNGSGGAGRVPDSRVDTETDAADYDLDETDLALLERIERDFDVSLQQLADEVGVSKSAVHYRLKNLEAAGVVRGRVADLDPAAFGLDTVVVTEVTVAHEAGYAEDIGEQLAALPGVEQAYYTMGDVDFLLVSRLRTREGTNELIDSVVAIDGVNETASRFVMKELSTGGKLLGNLSPERRAALLE
ncbi:Lrp/AsnC family transcriptional regulator [Halobium salinum]|uniref:Lrp/AsnC family transcriptional regulator n=1 Tax=Halobium salinum TaxID=1364940 RepID=A0ABD5PIB9_9EURY|nr:Lrp/AsnC family transcriptional regulator [Halobium salinum]